MKLTLTIPILLLSLFVLLPASMGQGVCTCKSPDKKCAPRVRCPHGCTALCGDRDACYAACGSIERDRSYARITLKVEDKDSTTIATLLTKTTGRKIEFVPKDKAELFSFELKNDPVWKALAFLNKRGTILVDDTPFDQLENLRRKTSNNEKLAISFTGVRVRDALAKLSFVSGSTFEVDSGDPDQFLSISVEDVTLAELITRISEQTGVKIVETEKSAFAK